MIRNKLKENGIGRIPEDWRVVKVKDVAKINELSIDKNFKHDKIEYIDISSIENRQILNVQNLSVAEAPSRAKRIVRDNDILISTVRPNLKHFTFIQKANANTIASTGFAVITSYKVNPRYLYYCLTTDTFTNFLSQIADAHTSTYPAFNPDVIENADLFLPPESEQNKIANILGSLDSKIALNRSMNSTLEAIGQALFKRWFVDFEFPNEEGKPYKSSGGEMIDSELGEVPKGWEVKSIDEIAEFLNGIALQKYPPKDENFLPVIKIRELRQGATESSDKASPDIDKKYIVEDGDILFSWSGSLAVCIWCGGQGALNQHLFKVSSQDYPKWFYYQWVKFYLPEFQHIAEGKATTMGHIQRHHLAETFVAVPPKETFERMNKIMNPLIEKYISNAVEARKLSKIRDALLPKLMSGEIRIR